MKKENIAYILYTERALLKFFRCYPKGNEERIKELEKKVRALETQYKRLTLKES